MIVLSIYIATYNRKNILIKKIKEILNVRSKEFDVWVLDDCSDDGTYETLVNISDERLHVIRNKERIGIKEDGVMPNWFTLLENCDGKFAMHLNDRDIFYADKLIGLIKFLSNHPDYTGGICDDFLKIRYYLTPENALLNIPYKAAHPTGIIFRMDLYKKIPQRELLFKKKLSYIHPHDLVLGKLSEYGNMFKYFKIFELADSESFASNKSFYYNKGNEKTLWFAPEERLKEFEMFIKNLNSLKFSKKIKKRKSFEIAKSYLYYCTFNYKYYITDFGQTQHYGIEQQKFGRKELIKCARQFCNISSIILRRNNLLDIIFLYKIKMALYFLAICIAKPAWNLYKKRREWKW